MSIPPTTIPPIPQTTHTHTAIVKFRAILSPYRRSNRASTWSTVLDAFPCTDDLATPGAGHMRVGTIQGFKGLEADVVILVGIDSRCMQHPATLYVGASRARAALVVLALAETGLGGEA